MDFKIIYDDHEEIHETLKTVIYSIKQSIAHWNNFYPETRLIIKFEKVSSKTDTIGINVQEDVKTDDKIS